MRDPAEDRHTIDERSRSHQLAHELSPERALVALLRELGHDDAVRAASKLVSGATNAPSRERATELAERASALAALVRAHDAWLRASAQRPPRTETDEPRASPPDDAALRAVEHLFDWGVRQHEEASCALYALGDATMLRRATDEIVALLGEWHLLGADRDVLEIGCGIGRVLEALSPHVRTAHGIDISGEMIARGTLRCAALPNVHLQKSSGRDLAIFPDATFDLVLAVDSLPYIVQVSETLAATHVREARRVLRPGGSIVILNYSYRGDHGADDADVRRLANETGLTVELSGIRPLRSWNCAAWLLRAP